MPIFMCWIYWNPDKDILTIPLLNRPISWYGLLFVSGLILSYWIVASLLKTLLKERHIVKSYEETQRLALSLTDKLTWFIVFGIVVGARLGHVFFYDWPYYQHYPLDIFKIWEGGLASHGGALGILIALGIFRWRIHSTMPALTFWTLADTIAVPTALTGAFIRVGNFFNQEILGTPSNAPWAVLFGQPADHSPPLARHPVQLYEAMAYLFLFVILMVLWKKTKLRNRPGCIAGLFFILTFTARFFLEFFKTSQSIVIDESSLQMGQYLSIPFICCGIVLVIYSLRTKNIIEINS